MKARKECTRCERECTRLRDAHREQLDQLAQLKEQHLGVTRKRETLCRDRLAAPLISAGTLASFYSREEGLLIQAKKLQEAIATREGILIQLRHELSLAMEVLAQAAGRVSVLEEEQKKWEAARLKAQLDAQDEEGEELFHIKGGDDGEG
ncbi:hypothetical protein KKF84_09625 [Myxococcota bacterium]|nr:hypothetical protein [Myxococcota bacterium]MBU1535570.1 hypothetical protein [Myxococcota bacterium]